MLRSRHLPFAGTRFVEPCLPSPARNIPSGPGWIHEIKRDGLSHDGVPRRRGRAALYDMRLRLDRRFPAITNAAEVVWAKSFLIDGEAVSSSAAVSSTVRAATRTALLCSRCYGSAEMEGWPSCTRSTCCSSTAEICDATRLRSGRHSSRA